LRSRHDEYGTAARRSGKSEFECAMTQTMEDAMNVHVLIVGAGPTGLMLANQLARRGVRAMIIDRHSGPAQQTRAMAVHARTLEIYAKMGLAEEALARGARGEGADFTGTGSRAGRCRQSGCVRSSARWPRRLQPRLEARARR
jgi:2-polyprenyl-6-methoxyphenol hydroxylase-like FAD-dependent oxidoreductase